MSYPVNECCCGNKNRLITSAGIISSRKIYSKELCLNIVWRRRICDKCKGRFTSYELDACDINFFAMMK